MGAFHIIRRKRLFSHRRNKAIMKQFYSDELYICDYSFLARASYGGLSHVFFVDFFYTIINDK